MSSMRCDTSKETGAGAHQLRLSPLNSPPVSSLVRLDTTAAGDNRDARSPHDPDWEVERRNGQGGSSRREPFRVRLPSWASRPFAAPYRRNAFCSAKRYFAQKGRAATSRGLVEAGGPLIGETGTQGNANQTSHLHRTSLEPETCFFISILLCRKKIFSGDRSGQSNPNRGLPRCRT